MLFDFSSYIFFTFSVKDNVNNIYLFLVLFFSFFEVMLLSKFSSLFSNQTKDLHRICIVNFTEITTHLRYSSCIFRIKFDFALLYGGQKWAL